jgi:hypothetical protein
LCKYLIRPVYTKNAFSIVWPNFESRGTTRKASIFIGALTPGIKQKATSVRLSNPSYGLLEPGKVGRQKKERKKKLQFGLYIPNLCHTTQHVHRR